MEHIPVLLEEVIENLNIKEDGIYLDLTLGRAGHSSEILKRIPKGMLIGVDQDIEAIQASSERLNKIGSNYKIVHSNFIHVNEILDSLGIDKVDGILMDLGVSSPQFDNPLRGFSYREDAPLDMRMDQRSELTAREIVNTYNFEKLTYIFRAYGDEKYAASIANNIIKKRNEKPIETTFQMVDIIKMSKPMKELKKVGHPAKQVFQALRIAVNDELNVLTSALEDTLGRLKPNGGRLAVITFHSGEDRIVKNIFKEYAVSEGNRNNFPLHEEEKPYRLVNHKVIIASEEELQNNHRSVSAKLRVIERK